MLGGDNNPTIPATVVATPDKASNKQIAPSCARLARARRGLATEAESARAGPARKRSALFIEVSPKEIRASV